MKTIKEQVKHIFQANTFETALELTRDLRGEYIREYGVKSWNALVSYYRKAILKQKVTQVAEPECNYTDTSKDNPSDDANANSNEKDSDATMMILTPDNVGELHNTLSGLFSEEKESTCKEFVSKEDKPNVGKKLIKTTMMQQYEEMKKKHPDALLLFRVGDFYELFGEDAIDASDVLGITLTRRMNGKAGSIELTGFPHHALDTYLPKLVRAGKRVAICEQLEEHKKVTVKEVVESANQIKEEQKDITKPTTDTHNYPEEEERVAYMLYQNDGEKVDWYGHFVNYKGLKVGDRSMMVRMNNLGVGKGKVLATASMTMKEIEMFHKCYAAIRQSTPSDTKRVELFTKAFNNLQSAMRDSRFAILSTGKTIANFVLNYKEEG